MSNYMSRNGYTKMTRERGPTTLHLTQLPPKRTTRPVLPPLYRVPCLRYLSPPHHPPLTPLSLLQPLSHARVLSLSLALAYSLSLSLSHGHMYMHAYEAGERGFVANRQCD